MHINAPFHAGSQPSQVPDEKRYAGLHLHADMHYVEPRKGFCLTPTESEQL